MSSLPQYMAASCWAGTGKRQNSEITWKKWGTRQGGGGVKKLYVRPGGHRFYQKNPTFLFFPEVCLCIHCVPTGNYYFFTHCISA
jgi:hypothetical protein